MKPLAEQTLYELLEVAADASDSEIVQAWERMQAVYGAGSLATYTLMAPDEAALLGERLEEARTVLLDPAARHDYDARLSGTSALLRARPERLATVTRLPTAAEPAAPRRDGLALAPEQLSLLDEPAVIVLRHEVAPEQAAIRLEAIAPVSPPFAAVAPPPEPPAASPAATPTPRPPRRAGPPERELFVPEGTPYTGDVLRRAREARGLTLEQVCARTKILRQHVENLEGDRHDRLPAAVYLRGILMALARELRLDGQKVARSYLASIAPGHDHARPSR